MEQQHLYEKVIGRKLNNVTPADKNHVWPSLEQKLDKVMPQQKDETDKKQSSSLLKNAMLVAAGFFATVAGIFTLRFVAGKTQGSASRIVVVDCSDVFK